MLFLQLIALGISFYYLNNDTSSLTHCLYIPELSIEMMQTPQITFLEINPEIKKFTVHQFLQSSELHYRTRSVNNTYLIETYLQISTQDIKEFIDSFATTIYNNKGKIALGCCIFFALCYALGSIPD